MRYGLRLIITFLVLASMALVPMPSGALDYGMDQNLGNVDASFWGERMLDYSGCSVACAGDVNGDGYDDILIGASNNHDGGLGAGQTYLILGKASGWAMEIKLTDSDASF